MGRAPCCEKVGLKKGPWSPEEDQLLISYITLNGHGNWRSLPKKAGLLRCGKSCRLRWINYLRPDIKRGNFTGEEEDAIINLHQNLGNRWSAIAARLPGRTDNEIKNVWHTYLKKRLKNKQEENIKETIGAEIKSQPVTTSATTSREGHSDNHHVPLSPQPCSDITEDISSRRSITNDNRVGSTSKINTSLYNNMLLKEIDEPFWSDVLSEGTKSSSLVAAEASPFQLSPLSGYGMEENGGFVGGVYDNVMEFWYEGLHNSEEYFALNS